MIQNDKNEEVLKEDFQLGNSWSLSESYQSTEQKHFSNFSSNNNTVFDFSTLGSFALFWKHSNYSAPSSLFYDDVNNMIRKFKARDNDPEEKVVDSINLFKRGIKPMWEDPLNQNGCSYDINLKGLAAEQIDDIWRSLVLCLVTDNFPFVQYVTGVRILDRIKKHDTIRVEIWMSVGLKSHKQDSEEFIRNEIVIKTVVEHFVSILNRTVPVTEVELTKHDHEIRLKVN